MAAAARVPRRDAAHAPGRERHARARRPGGPPPVARGGRAAVQRTCSTPTRRASARCSPPPTPPPAAGCARRRPTPPRRPRPTGRSSRRATPRTAGRRGGRRGAAFAGSPPPPARPARALPRGRRLRSTRAARLHRRAAHPRRVRAPRPAAAALPRARAGRVRPRRRRRPRDARVRDPGGRRLPHGAGAALADLGAGPARAARPAAHDAARAGLAELRQVLAAATEGARGRSEDAVAALAQRVEDDLRAVMPKAWQQPNDESDYDLIALTLDRIEAAVGAGQYAEAEQARLEAYAFFEFGPERRLKSFDPGLATDVEGLIWFGAAGEPGLAKLIADHAQPRDVHETRLVLDAKLDDAAATLGDAASRTTVVTNSAIIVFREGLEAVLILAAITASFVGARRRLRRPVLVGAGLGLLVSIATWVLAQTLLTSLERYGEKLEAVVGLIAIAVLLLIMNWFFHRVYWSEWIGRFHRRRRRLPATSARLLLRPGVRPGAARADQRLPRGLRDRALPAVARAQRRHGHGARGRRPRARAGAGRGRVHLRPPAQAAVQEDAGRDRPADRARAGRDGRPDGADDAGHRLAADHPGARRRAVLGGPVVRRLPDLGDARRAGRRVRVRGRLLLPRPGGPRQAAAARARRARRTRRPILPEREPVARVRPRPPAPRPARRANSHAPRSGRPRRARSRSSGRSGARPRSAPGWGTDPPLSG